jgi:hypothetical protein
VASSSTRHAARRRDEPAAGQHLHEPLPEALATQRAAAKRFRAHIVNYADDFVILSRGHAAEALAWTKAVMTKLGLTLNEAKTSLKDARNGTFDFPGLQLRIAGRVIASDLRCSRGSYRQHATKGSNVNKGDPSGSSASL